MGMVNVPYLNFTGGAIGRLLAARVDFPAYPTSGELFTNVWPIPQGPYTRRPPLKYIDTFVDSALKGFQIPFNTDDQAYDILATSDGFEFFTEDGKIANEAVSTMILEGDFTLTHPDIFDASSKTSSTLAAGSLANLHDENVTTGATWNATATGTLTWDYGSSITMYDLWLWATSTPNRAPLAMQVHGSATGAFAGEQVLVLDILAQPNWASQERRKFRITAPGSYRYYRLSMLTRESGSGDYQLSEVSTFDNPWLDRSTGNAVVTPVAGLNFLDSDGGGYAITEQLVPIVNPDVLHILKFDVVFGPVNLRIGTTSNGQDVPDGEGNTFDFIDLATGTHYLEFTPPISDIDSFALSVLHFDGFDGSVSIADHGFAPKVWTAAGNAQLDTGQSKFGGTSLLLDGTGDRVTSPDHADFEPGAGAFTVDGFINVAHAGSATLHGIFAKMTDFVAATHSFAVMINGSNLLELSISDGTTRLTVAGTTQLNDSTNTGWHHFEVNRSLASNTVNVFLDGVLEASASFTGTVPNLAAVVEIGAMANNNFFTGWIDELRWTKGASRHGNVNFTPPIRARHRNEVYLQFYHKANAGRIIDNVSIVATQSFNVDHPYTEDELPQLQWQQIGDKLYLTHNNHWPRRLERRGHRSWSLVKHLPNDGPMGDLNTTGITIAGSAVSGEINLTASEPLFTADDNGVLYRMVGAGQTRTAVATSGDVATAGIKVTGIGAPARTFRYDILGTFVATVTLQRSSGNENDYTDFQNFTVPTSATFYDALDNQTWFYRLIVKSGNYTSGTVNMTLTYAGGSSEGTVRIIAVVNPTLASAEVIETLASTNPVVTWRRGAWNGEELYPVAVAHCYARLWFGRGITIWGSASDNFDSFLAGTLADNSITATLASAGAIRWMAALGHLIIGTTIREMLGVANTTSQAIGPANFQTLPGTNRGGLAKMPAVADGSVLFMARTGTRLMQFTQNPKALSETSYVAVDLNELSPEFLDDGVERIVLQKNPEPRVYVLLKSGLCRVLLFRRDIGDLGIAAWATIHTKNGFLEDVNVISEGDRDAVYFIVRRLINGVAQRSIQKLGPHVVDSDEDDFYLDASLSLGLSRPFAYASANGRTGSIIVDTDLDVFSAPDVGAKIWINKGKGTITAVNSARSVDVDVIFELSESDEWDEIPIALPGRWGLGHEVSGVSGLSHLEGEEVRIHADGGDAGMATVSGGSISLPYPASCVHVGIDTRARWKSMKLSHGHQKGTGLTQIKAVKNLSFVLDRTGPGIYYGPSFTRLSPLIQPMPQQFGAPPPLFTGELMQPFNASYNTDSRMHVEIRGSHPATVLAYVPQVDEKDR